MELPSAVTLALPWVQWVIIIMLFFVSGIAWCFNLWCVPLIRLNKSTSALVQMEEMARRGGIWLEPGNAFIAALSAVTALATSQHPNPAEAAAWRYYAAAAFTLLQVAWWERWTVFPLDDEIAAMKDDRQDVKGAGQKWLDDDSELKLKRLLDRWTLRHGVRAALPVVAALIAVSPKVIQTLP